MDNTDKEDISISPDSTRKAIVDESKLIVIKVGTRVLTTPAGQIDEDRISELASDICDLTDSGKRVVLVSSGAVGAGMSQLRIRKRPTDVSQLQAVAAIGQAHLINIYNRTMQSRGHHAAQVLLTADDVDNRRRYLNVRNTLFAALEMGAIPVVNENDTVAVEELITTFGDNDHLAARVTNLLQAKLLIILSDVDGLFDGHPDDPGSQLIDIVTSIDDQVMRYINDQRNQLSRGGMASKIAAARAVTLSGEHMIIARGNQRNTLRDIFKGMKVGTLFVAKSKSLAPRKRWLGYSLQTSGKIILDEGAVNAICTKGRSLLPIGIVGVEGEFSNGDGVALCDQTGKEIARGLTNYSSKEILKIQGLNSEKIEETLGKAMWTEVVHRNNLTVI